MNGVLKTKKTALVIGAGFVGAASAFALQRAGWQVTLVDIGDERRGASWGNAGHLATEQIQPLASWATLRTIPKRLFAFGGPVGLPLNAVGEWLPFGLRLMQHAGAAQLAQGTTALSWLLADSLPAWQRLAANAELGNAISDTGHYVAWESSASAKRGRAHWLSSNIGTAQIVDASSDEITTLKEKFNHRPVAAMRFKNTGQVLDIATTRNGLNNSFLLAGGVRLNARVNGLCLEGGQAYVHLNNGTKTTADIVLVAAGVDSAALFKPFGVKIPMISERGYHVEAPIGMDGDRCLPVAFEDRSVIVTHFKKTVRIAGFTEFADLKTAPDQRKWQTLMQHATQLGLPMNDESSQWVGARPTLPDYLPAIGRAKVANNLLYAFGHQHLGVTLAAISAELVVKIASDQTPSYELSSFDLARFQ